MKKIYEFYYNYRMKIKMYLCIILIIGIFGLLYFYYIKEDKSNSIYKDNIITKEENANRESEKEENKIYVDIKGEVLNSGVYEIEYGKRVIDVIEAAGGLKDGANTRFINLAKVVEDGDVIVIYSNDEINKAREPDIIYVEVPCVCEEVKNDACLENNISKNELININTASIDELKTLDGIGDAKAKSIIEYRNNNGKFEKIDDLLNVSGISEKIFDTIKNKITVN